jgi:hypothetical protein
MAYLENKNGEPLSNFAGTITCGTAGRDDAGKTISTYNVNTWHNSVVDLGGGPGPSDITYPVIDFIPDDGLYYLRFPDPNDIPFYSSFIRCRYLSIFPRNG